METQAILARLVAQAEGEGATLVTLRALAEGASAERALERLGLGDPAARARAAITAIILSLRAHGLIAT